jgi:hypothetical protein
MSERRGKKGLPNHVEWVSRGFRDVYWCPYLNEPVIITYPMDKNKTAWCVNCNGPMAEDHWFIVSIRKTPIQ